MRWSQRHYPTWLLSSCHDLEPQQDALEVATGLEVPRIEIVSIFVCSC